MSDDTGDDRKNSIQLLSQQSESIPADVYEDLLNRYERALVFAGQLQEKNRQQLLLQEKNQELEHQVDNLKKQVAVEESYVRLLENALKAIGLIKE
ncbi:MAG TPA: hypothetical protein VGL91_08855 [Acidobacteriota bacterium]|jgi:hypothetical protein